MENDKSLLLSMQTQIDTLNKDNIRYISLINDLYQQISNLKENILYKDKQIENLNNKVNDFITKDINKITQDKTFFEKFFKWN